MAGEADVLCGDHLAVDDLSRTNYLVLTFDDSPDERPDHWRRHV